MSINSSRWSKFFYRFSVRLLRGLAYPCAGIAVARFVVDPDATLSECLSDALLVLIFIVATAIIGFVLSWLLAEHKS